ncbi:22046_t:CDS:2, partial [Rhizophagus irregularis]
IILNLPEKFQANFATMTSVRPVLHRNWKVEIWFWNQGISKGLKNAISVSNMVKFCLLENYYKLFSCGDGIPSFKSNLLSLSLHGEDIYKWKNQELFACFKALDLFGWLKWEDNFTVHLYFRKGTLDRAINWINKNWIGADSKVEMWLFAKIKDHPIHFAPTQSYAMVIIDEAKSSTKAIITLGGATK